MFFFFQISTSVPRCELGCTFTVDAFTIILGVNLGGISFAAVM